MHERRFLMQYNPQYGNARPQQAPASMQDSEEHRISTNTPDKHFDLISVLYHSLQGAQTYAQYAEDAGREGDQELAQFFVRAQQQQLACAEAAKQMLQQRIGTSSLRQGS